MLTLLNPYNQPNFCAMKKSQFGGVDFAVVEKYKAPIEKFDTNDDLQKWAYNQSIESAKYNYFGRKPSTLHERKKILNNWVNYLYKNNKQYSDTEKFMMIKGITQDLKPNDDNLPPVLNKQILADTMQEIKKDLTKNRRKQFKFNDRYKTNLKEFYSNIGNDDNKKWIIIPSKINDPDNYENNVDKLKTLSPDGWCTKGDYAEIYLNTGNFHLFMDNGEAKLGLRFDGNEIKSIEGKKNDFKIPTEYLEICKNHIYKNKYKMDDKALDEIQKAEEKKILVDRIKENLSDAIETENTEKILNYFGIITKQNNDGYLILSEYKKPSNIDYSELGIDENKMLKDIIKIEGDAIFDGNATNLGSIKEIFGNVEIGPHVNDLGNLEKVGGTMDVYSYDLKKANKLKDVRGGVRFLNGIGWDIYMDMINKGISAGIL